MKNLTKAFCATLLFAAPMPALAQGIAVHDSANLIQQINAVRQAIQVVAQGKQQIAEAQKLYQDLNKLTDIPQLAQRLKSDMNKPEINATIERNRALARDLGIRGTPAFVIGEQIIPGAIDLETMRSVVARARQK